jgi:hypothetical protein
MTYKWEKITDNAAFSPRDGAGALSLNNKMWLLGGWNPDLFKDKCVSQVWSSSNGEKWTMECDAPWEPRHIAGYAVFREHMWVIGGDVNQGHYQNDIWCSKDGINWDNVSKDIPWLNRATHHTVVFNDKLWVLGGQEVNHFLKPENPRQNNYYNDVWHTADGRNWTQVTKNIPWTPRGQIMGAVVLNNGMWLLGGGTYNPRSYNNDVWFSQNGADWRRVNRNAPWCPRQFHNTIAFDDKMWVIGGFDGMGDLNDVWYSKDGNVWTELKDTPWAARHAASVFTHNNSLYLAAGFMFNDVWRLTK